MGKSVFRKPWEGLEEQALGWASQGDPQTARDLAQPGRCCISSLSRGAAACNCINFLETSLDQAHQEKDPTETNMFRPLTRAWRGLLPSKASLSMRSISRGARGNTNPINKVAVVTGSTTAWENVWGTWELWASLDFVNLVVLIHPHRADPTR